jgi:hypothetical protein
MGMGGVRSSSSIGRRGEEEEEEEEEKGVAGVRSRPREVAFCCTAPLGAPRRRSVRFTWLGGLREEGGERGGRAG